MPLSEDLSVSTSPTPRPFSVWAPALAVFLIGLALTGLVQQRVRSDNADQLAQRFAWVAAERRDALQARFDRQVESLDALRRFIRLDGALDQRRFAEFVDPLLPEALSYAWVARVSEDERGTFVEQARRDGLPAFELWGVDAAGQVVPAIPRAEHFVVRFHASDWVKPPPLGFDLLSRPSRGEVLERARRNGAIATSSLLGLIQGPANYREGILLAAPVGAGDRAGSSGFRGFALGILSVRQLMEPAIAANAQRELFTQLFDLSDESRREPIYRSGETAAASSLSLGEDLVLGDRRYRLELRPTAAFVEANRASGAPVVTVLGLLLSLSMGAFIYVLGRQRRQALLTVAERNADLALRSEQLRLSDARWTLVLEGTGDGVWDWDLASDELFCSETLQSMLGYDQAGLRQLLAGDARNLLHPDDYPAREKAQRRLIEGLEEAFVQEYRVRSGRGDWKWVLDRARVVERMPGGSARRVVGSLIDISRRKRFEQELAHANAQLRGILDSATLASIIATDTRGRVITFNVGAERMLGYRAEEMLGKELAHVHLPVELEAQRMLLSRQAGHPLTGFEVLIAGTQQASGHDEREWTLIRRDGVRLSVNLIVTTMYDSASNLSGYLFIGIDISEQARARRALEERDALLAKLSARVPGALYLFCRDEQGHSTVPYASEGLAELFEVSLDELRDDAAALVSRIHPEDRSRVQASAAHSMEALSLWQEDFRIVVPEKGLIWCRGESFPERQADGSTLWYGCLMDITGLKQVEENLRQMAITDPLTGLRNRRYFNERLTAEIARVQRQRGMLALVMLDIDHFKTINDRYGHQAGDEVLARMSTRLAKRLRRADVLCRLGGEELIVLCPDTDASAASSLAESLRQTLHDDPEPIASVTASFGVAAWQPGEQADDLLRRVDDAMYRAKGEGRDRVVLAD